MDETASRRFIGRSNFPRSLLARMVGSTPSSEIRHLLARTRSSAGIARIICPGYKLCMKARMAMPTLSRTSSAAPLACSAQAGIRADRTNTIGQGDTRASGLTNHLVEARSTATRRFKWPGQAAVVVSVVHMGKGESSVTDPRPRRCGGFQPISSRAISTRARSASSRTSESFQGSIVLGMGFTFDDVAAAKGEAKSLAKMMALIEQDPRNAERVLPYLGGEEVNNSPTHAHHRYVIDFGAMDENQIRATWPDLLAIVETRVKPKRMEQASIVNPDRWWMHARSAVQLYGKRRLLAFHTCWLRTGRLLHIAPSVFCLQGQFLLRI